MPPASSEDFIRSETPSWTRALEQCSQQRWEDLKVGGWFFGGLSGLGAFCFLFLGGGLNFVWFLVWSVVGWWVVFKGDLGFWSRCWGFRKVLLNSV